MTIPQPPNAPETDAVRTRRRLIGAGAAALAAGAVASVATTGDAKADPAASREALRLLLSVERAQSELYGLAVARGGFSPEVAGFVALAADHERRHVSALAAAAEDPIDAARYDFSDAVDEELTFIPLAAALEDLSVATFNGQVGNMGPRDLAAAARIVSVDARHAAVLRALVGDVPADAALDDPVGPAEVRRRLGALGVTLGTP